MPTVEDRLKSLELRAFQAPEWSGRALRVLRAQRQLSQAGLGRLVGQAQGVISRLEKGSVPNANLASRIARVLAVKLEALFDG